MRRLAAVAVVFLAAGLAVGGWNLTHGTAKADGDCQVRTAWSGVESTAQQDGELLEQFPLTAPVEITRVEVSGSFAATSGVPSGFAEELVLLGASPGPVSVGADDVPVTQADPMFGPSQVDSTDPWNGQPALQDGVIGARIVKTTSLDAAFTVSFAPPSPVTVPAGGVLWLFQGTIGPTPLDPEAQMVVSYLPGGC